MIQMKEKYFKWVLKVQTTPNIDEIEEENNSYENWESDIFVLNQEIHSYVVAVLATWSWHWEN